MGSISNAHKATIKRHLDESLADGIPLDQIHKELAETFSVKGKYQREQITATTSWLLSEALRSKRKTEMDWNENEDGKTNEDTDFDNDAKNASRRWMMENVQKHIPFERRRSMYFSILPGKNTHDFDAVEGIGMSCRNLLTFILGEDPKSVAQYIRNCRAYGVADREIGDMADLLPQGERPIEGLYWDFFGQMCPTHVKTLWSVPLAENDGPIPVGLNLMRGRENAEMSEAIKKFQLVADFRSQISEFPRMDRLSEIIRTDLDQDQKKKIKLSDTRDSAAQTAFFTRIGVANTKNWVLENEAKLLIERALKLEGDERKYDELTNHEKVIQFELIMGKVSMMCDILRGFIEESELPSLACVLPLLVSATTMAVTNRPTIIAAEQPKEYVSPQGNRPFTSYFCVIETHRRKYVQYAEAMQFLFDIMHHVYEPIYNDQKDIAEGRSRTEVNAGYFFSKGSGKNKEIFFLNAEKQIVAQINYDFLIEASFELSSSAHNALDGSISRQQSIKKQAFENLKQVAHMEDLIEGAKQKIPRAAFSQETIRNIEDKTGRNAPCRCGSGKKFKKCCMRG